MRISMLVPTLALLSTAAHADKAEPRVVIEPAHLSLALPAAWGEPRQNATGDRKVWTWMRKPISEKEDASGVVMVMTEPVPAATELPVYSGMLRAKQPFEVKSVFNWQSGPLTYKNAIGYSSEEGPTGSKFVGYHVHTIVNGVGASFTLVTPARDEAQVDAELRAIVKSITAVK